jgi:hypothetical protein
MINNFKYDLEKNLMKLIKKAFSEHNKNTQDTQKGGASGDALTDNLTAKIKEKVTEEVKKELSKGDASKGDASEADASSGDKDIASSDDPDDFLIDQVQKPLDYTLEIKNIKSDRQLTNDTLKLSGFSATVNLICEGKTFPINVDIRRYWDHKPMVV